VGAGQLDPASEPLQVPKELWWLLEHLYQNALKQVSWIFISLFCKKCSGAAIADFPYLP